MGEKKRILEPHQVRYRLLKIFIADGKDKPPLWPGLHGLAAASVAEQYERDYQRCCDVSDMIRADEAALKEVNDA